MSGSWVIRAVLTTASVGAVVDPDAIVLSSSESSRGTVTRVLEALSALRPPSTLSFAAEVSALGWAAGVVGATHLALAAADQALTGTPRPLPVTLTGTSLFLSTLEKSRHTTMTTTLRPPPHAARRRRGRRSPFRLRARRRAGVEHPFRLHARRRAGVEQRPHRGRARHHPRRQDRRGQGHLVPPLRGPQRRLLLQGLAHRVGAFRRTARPQGLPRARRHEPCAGHEHPAGAGRRHQRRLPLLGSPPRSWTSGGLSRRSIHGGGGLLPVPAPGADTRSTDDNRLPISDV